MASSLLSEIKIDLPSNNERRLILFLLLLFSLQLLFLVLYQKRLQEDTKAKLLNINCKSYCSGQKNFPRP